MVATDMNARRQLVAGGGAVIALTALGALLEVIDPASAGNTRPHPTLTGSLGDTLGIFANNLRVLAGPFVCVALGFPDSRIGRIAGDLLVLAITALSAIPGGIELARWNTVLLAYVPQLPVEWAALSTAVTAWLAARRGAVDRWAVTELAVLAAVLLALAACLETWCVPHRAVIVHASRPSLDAVREPVSLWGSGGCLATDLCAGTAGSLQGRKLPSPHQFGSARPLPAHTGLSSTTRPPQGGIT